jgi:hypothetical protein
MGGEAVSESGWYLSEADQSAIDTVVTRCIVEAADAIGDAIKASWHYSWTEGGRLVAVIVPKDGERFWDEEKDVHATVALADAIRECRDQKAVHGRDVFLTDVDELESALKEIEEAIAFVRAGYANEPETGKPEPKR